MIKNNLRFDLKNKVDSMDWLLKIAYADTNPIEIIEDKRLWNIGEWGTLTFVEVFQNETVVARFMYTEDIVFTIIVYPPYRNQGIFSEIMDWLNNNTSIYLISTINPIVKKTIPKYGYRFLENKPGGVDETDEKSPVEWWTKK